MKTEDTKQRTGPSTSVFVVVLLALLFAGALFWARGRDPFHRIWFHVRAPGLDNAECIAVVPKNFPDSAPVSSLTTNSTSASSLQPLAFPPRPPSSRLPVVVYLHGARETVLGSGNEMRQMAEMGLAVVGLEYNQTNEVACDAELAALLDWLGRQKWADTNRMAWVGFSLGAGRVLSFALDHPERRPKSIVCLSGGPVGRSEVRHSTQEDDVQSPKPKVGGPSSAFRQQTSVLLVHGERDEVFPAGETRETAEKLREGGLLTSSPAAVELKVLPGQFHGFGENRLQVFRALGEYCLEQLSGREALQGYESILVWQARAWPLWVYWMPAGAWTIFYLWKRTQARKSGIRNKSETNPNGEIPKPERSTEGNEIENSGGRRVRFLRSFLFSSKALDITLGCLAAVLAVAAITVSALHLVPPRLVVGERTLGIARKHIVQPKERADFEVLASKPLWQGKTLGILLEHVELAIYNRELIDWKLDDAVYRDYVLSPEIDPERDGDFGWRRPLWESFYPRIRKQQTTAAAAEIVVRYLRERVTIQGVQPVRRRLGEGGSPKSNLSAVGSAKAEVQSQSPVSDLQPSAFSASCQSIAEAWREQITDARGFDCLYVAAMRSAGIPARLDGQGRPEFWTGSAWQLAPRPLIESCWSTGR